ncbi:MAG: lytic transglycosylase domain-containing protein [Pseudomonadota bacterium]
MLRTVLTALFLVIAHPALAEDTAEKKVEEICGLIETSASEASLPPDFLARLIWKESRFDEQAISPAGAQGIAQFMPATANRRGLENPFDKAEAIPASALYLAELRQEFGSLGRAAAAYNAGESRVRKWLAGKSGLPAETRDYVFDITGQPAAWFFETVREAPLRPLSDDLTFAEGCRALPVVATRASPRPAYGVVVAGGRSRRAANIAFERARRQNPRLISREDLHFVWKSRRAAGPKVTAQLGFGSRGEAVRLCRALQRKGGTCRVARN